MRKVKVFLTEQELKLIKRLRQIYPQGLPEQVEQEVLKVAIERQEPYTAFYTLGDVDINEFMRVNYGEPTDIVEDEEPDLTVMIDY